MKIFVTGVAGFIGMHCAQKLLERGDQVIGIDSLNNYYDIELKRARLRELSDFNNFSFVHLNLQNRLDLSKLFAAHKPQRVIHLAAQAGVRYSLSNPFAYCDSNLEGFLGVLEGCKENCVDHLVYASSSSVYGGNKNLPFREVDSVDRPLSLYAATKKANELMAHTYSHLYEMPTTGLRFFTVYGPWGRPDMALFLFTKAILNRKPIEIFNNGEMSRDFTYISDVVEGVVRVLDKPQTQVGSNETEFSFEENTEPPSQVFNLGNGSPVMLMDYITALERALGMEAEKVFLKMQPGDVKATFADTQSLQNWIGFRPRTTVDDGVRKFVDWYKSYYA